MKVLVDRLGVKPDSRITLLGDSEPEFVRQLKQCTPHVVKRKVDSEADFIFFAAEQKDDLDMLAVIRYYLDPKGAVWVIYPKKQSQIRKADLLKAGRRAGLADRKSVRFSDTHTALKFVIPAAEQTRQPAHSRT